MTASAEIRPVPDSAEEASYLSSSQKKGTFSPEIYVKKKQVFGVIVLESEQKPKLPRGRPRKGSNTVCRRSIVRQIGEVLNQYIFKVIQEHR